MAFATAFEFNPLKAFRHSAVDRRHSQGATRTVTKPITKIMYV
jgi:hypothetical protein